MKNLEKKYKKTSRVVAKAELSYWGLLVDVLVAAILGGLVAVLWIFAPQIEGALAKSTEVAYLTEQNLKWALLGVGIFTILMLTIHFISIKNRELIITEHDLLYRTGFFNVDYQAIPLNEIKLIHSNQKFLARLFNYGTLVITSEGDAKIKIKGIMRPERFAAKAIKQAETGKNLTNKQQLTFSVK